jgi:hypothetical protein
MVGVFAKTFLSSKNTPNGHNIHQIIPKYTEWQEILAFKGIPPREIRISGKKKYNI